jgi:uncharacterized lipoprotein YmbA
MQKQWFIVMVAAVLIAGCATTPQPFDYHDDRDEKPGPGLFSGEEGGLVIYGDTMNQPADNEEPPAQKKP